MIRHNEDCVHTVSRSDPAFLFHSGEGFERHRLPEGSLVIYGTPPLAQVDDRVAAINHALDHPEGDEPLDGQLRPGMKVTIAFDDVSLPVPPMRRPDIRQTVMEIVIDRLDKAGVTDVEIICAICLHRRCTPAELKRFVGPRVFSRFWPDRLYNHDAEDPEGNVHLGTTARGEEVELNRRAVESDLLIYVNINLVPMDGGHKSVPVGLATYKSVRHHHNAEMLLEESSYMDPERSHFHRSCERMGDIAKKHVKIFTIETTLNGATFHPLLDFMQKREKDWHIGDKLNYHFSSRALKMLPSAWRRKAYNALPAMYQLAYVHAGETDAVHAKTLDGVHEQQCVQVPHQCDIMLLGLPALGPYNVNSIQNPLLINCLGMGYFFNFYRHRPVVKKGGVTILVHPFKRAFNKIHHPSYIDFYDEVLPQTRDPHEMEHKFEKSYAENERYIDLYRNSYAYHGVHPFYMWYWGAHGNAHCSKVIAVNPGEEEVARRLGYEVAKDFDSALGMAKDIMGQNASISYLHTPPILMCDVMQA